MNDNNIKIEKLKSIEKLDFPPILYKYRDWADENHRRVLTHNELFLASPKSFEDEFDCKVPIRYDLLTDEEIYEIYFNESKKENPNYNRQQHRKFAKEWQKKGHFRDKEHIDEIENKFRGKFCEELGVLSLTDSPNNFEMWEHYANNHKGFCVGLKTDPLLQLSNFPSTGKVKYYDEFPIIKFTNCFIKQSIQQIYSKLNKWNFENEYRISKTLIQNRQIKIPITTFDKIIIGEKMLEESKKEIISVVKEKLPKMQILQAEIKNNSIIINKY